MTQSWDHFWETIWCISGQKMAQLHKGRERSSYFQQNYFSWLGVAGWGYNYKCYFRGTSAISVPARKQNSKERKNKHIKLTLWQMELREMDTEIRINKSCQQLPANHSHSQTVSDGATTSNSNNHSAGCRTHYSFCSLPEPLRNGMTQCTPIRGNSSWHSWQSGAGIA